MDGWRVSYMHEMQQAIAARASGNEGRARVCTRRAASVLIGEYSSRQGLQLSSTSAYDRLRFLASQPGLSNSTYEIIAHLLERVNESFSLPPEIDLLAEVQQLAHELQLQ